MRRAADWLAQAQRDLALATQNLEGGWYEWACFAAQQAAEKAVKAALKARGTEAWGHSVADLLRELGRLGAAVPEEQIDGALELDKHYITARYPDALPAGHPGERYTRTEAARSISHAEGIVELGAGLLAPVDQG